MADGTYFVGRNELLSWINSTLSLGLTKIEQTASGAVACQLMDALHPGSVNLSKVDFNSRSEYDSINNYKALQAAFARAGIDKPVDVARLVKARPLDNIEFMQWFKSYWDSRTGGGGGSGGERGAIEGYDARARRAASKTGDVRGGGGGNGGNDGAPSSSSSARSSQEAAGAGAGAGGAVATATAGRGAPLHSSGASISSRENIAAGGGSGGGGAGARPSSTPKAAAAAAGQRRQRTTTTAKTAAAAAAAPPPSSSSSSNATATIAELTSALAEARLRASAAERERDFYFDKLRDIELLCGAPGLLEDEQGKPIAAAEAALRLVERVLFAADEAGAKEVLAEVGVVATGATPPPPSEAPATGEEGVAVAARQ